MGLFGEMSQKCDCGGSFKFTLDDVARGRTVRCTRGCSIQLEDGNGEARRASAAEREFEKSLNKLSRSINFKL